MKVEVIPVIVRALGTLFRNIANRKELEVKEKLQDFRLEEITFSFYKSGKLSRINTIKV